MMHDVESVDRRWNDTKRYVASCMVKENLCMYRQDCTQYYSSSELHEIKVTGYSCARRAKCIGKCILKLANQESLLQTA